MTATYLAAFICYGLAALLSTLFGITYLIRSTFMPYHQEALGKTWQQLDPNLQILLLGLMRTAGGGLLAAGLSIVILLVIPFRAEEIWARYSIPVIGLVTAIPALYATILIRARTQAHTPVAIGSIAAGLFVIGFIFSII